MSHHVPHHQALLNVSPHGSLHLPLCASPSSLTTCVTTCLTTCPTTCLTIKPPYMSHHMPHNPTCSCCWRCLARAWLISCNTRQHCTSCHHSHTLATNSLFLQGSVASTSQPASAIQPPGNGHAGAQANGFPSANSSQAGRAESGERCVAFNSQSHLDITSHNHDHKVSTRSAQHRNQATGALRHGPLAVRRSTQPTRINLLARVQLSFAQVPSIPSHSGLTAQLAFVLPHSVLAPHLIVS